MMHFDTFDGAAPVARAASKRRMRQPLALALMTGVAAIAAMVSVPVGLLELAIASLGLPELFPAAAPPLGWTARAMLAGFAGVLAFGIGLVASRLDAADEGEEQMGFAFSKLTTWTRRKSRDPEMPAIRRADAHPDAPPRKPIFASSDFDAPDFFTPAALPSTNEPEAVAVEAASPLGALAYEDFDADLPVWSPEPADDLSAQYEETAEAYEPSRDVAEPLPSPPLAAPSPLHELSVAELAQRLEIALTRRDAQGQTAARMPRPSKDDVRVLADIPPATPVPVKPAVDAQVDDALRQALGALQQMSGTR